MKKYYQENTEIMIENAKRARANNLDTYKKREKLFRQNNPDKVKEYNEKRKSKNHKITSKEWQKCLQYFNNSCAYCGMSNEEAKQKYNNYLHKEHVDHDGSNRIDNCVPACKVCNSEKRTMNLEIWYNEENPKYDNNRFDKIIKWIVIDHINSTTGH